MQRIAVERMALSSQCLSRQGCILCHQVHNTLLILEMLVLSHTRSAAQPQVQSRKTTTAAEACKNPCLDGLWIYGVTLSLGRIRYGYRNKYALGQPLSLGPVAT